MFITNLDEVLPVLRGRLIDYLSIQFSKQLNSKSRFPCFLHDGEDDNMGFDPKSGYETAHCFVCSRSGDIFAAASALEAMPSNGAGWLQETIPHLCKLLEVQLTMGEPSPADVEKAKYYKLAQNITDILIEVGDPTGYAAKRNWEQDDLVFGSIQEEELVSRLVSQGWDTMDIARSLMVKTNAQSFFGSDKLTLSIKDERGRPIGFQYRNLTERGPKYVNTPETPIYSKSKVLLGLDTALQDARRNGLYIVEGPGDLAQLKRLGIKNSVATCGTAFTEQHLLNLKALGVKQLFFCLDWDEAGTVATDRIFFNILNKTTGITASVVEAPSGEVKDVDELLKDCTDDLQFRALKHTPAFEWVLGKLSDNEPPDVVCGKMVPLIAAEPAAVKREMLIKKLASFTDVTYTAVLSDVNAIRNGKFEERKGRLLAAAEQYKGEVDTDPDNIVAIVAQHEQMIERIEKEYNREVIGVNYQLNRYESVQQLREQAKDGATGFKMGWFTNFEKAMEGGMPWSTGCLMYCGGAGNSGKTATCISIGTDIAMSDPEAMVLFHFTDDSYEQTEPRIKSNIARMLYPNYPRLSLGMIVNPKTNLIGYGSEYTECLRQSDEVFRQLLSEEKIVIIDSEDGSSMSTLEKNVRYYRQRYASRKMALIADNTHNYNDLIHLDQTQRITQIANMQKSLVTRYHACMIATAEYRKSQPRDPTKMILPTDDELADARALIYRPNVIFHVYNDLHNRKEHADIFWRGVDGQAKPRLLLHFTKNKISSFKSKLILDLDPVSVTLCQQDEDLCNQEAYDFNQAKKNGHAHLEGQKIIWMDADEYDGDEPTEAERQRWS